MTPSQRFYPTSWGFHPSGGSTAQLFNQGAHPARAARAGVCERPPGVFPGGRSWWGRGARSQAWAPWWGCGSPVELSCPVSAASTASAAAPPPQDDDPPPQDEPPPQEELPPPPQEEPPAELEWCPPEDEPSAHQLLRLRPLLRPRPLWLSRPPPLRTPAMSAATSTTPNTTRMMLMIMAPPSFRFPGSRPEFPRSRPPSGASLSE